MIIEEVINPPIKPARWSLSVVYSAVFRGFGDAVSLAVTKQVDHQFKPALIIATEWNYNILLSYCAAIKLEVNTEQSKKSDWWSEYA